MERDVFLGRLRQRLTVAPPHNLAHPLPAPSGVPRPGYPAAIGDDVVGWLRTTATAKSWQVRDIADAASFDALLDEVIAVHAVRRVLCSQDPEVEAGAVRERLERRGVDLVAFDGPTAGAEVDLGITGAAYAVAATASVVLSSGRAGGRSASLVPPVHLALVRAEHVLATPADIWRALPARFPDGMPSQLVFASGPSRSADIEFTLTVGVHGPKVVWLAILAPGLDLSDDGAR